jgi:hypothetical protein
MRFATYIRELAGLKVGVAIALVIALLAGVRVLYAVSIFPPGLERHSLEMASASTQVLVDTPRSTLVDLRQDIYELRSLSDRAVLIGNVMASPPVREFIARRANVPADEISVTAPLTAEQPRAFTDGDNDPRATDIFERPDDEYRLSVQANPTVPVLNIYAQAPDRAAMIANGAVDGLQDYLDAVADQRGTSPEDRVELQQLGRARGGVVNEGAGVAIAVVTAVLAFCASCAVVLLIARGWRGWTASRQLHRQPPARGLA